LPAGLASIGERAFASTSSLKQIYIPESVTVIGSYAFDESSGIQEVYCQIPNEPAGWSIDWIYNSGLAVFGVTVN